MTLYILIAILFALDAAVTLYALRKYPNDLGEANGLLRQAMAFLGRDGAMLLAKVLALAWVRLWNPQPVYLAAIAVMYAVVLVWNVYLVAKRARAA